MKNNGILSLGGQNKAQDAATIISSHLKKVITKTPIDNNTISLIEGIYNENSVDKIFKNEFVIGVKNEQLYLIAKIDKKIGNSDPTPLLWFWNNHLYPLYTLTLYWETVKSPIYLRAFIPNNSEVFNLLLLKPTQVVLLRKKHQLLNYTLNLPSVSDEIWELMDNRGAYESIQDFGASKVYVEKFIKSQNVSILKSTWAERLESEISVLVKYYRDPSLQDTFAEESKEILNTPYQDYFENNSNPIAHIYQSHVKGFLSKDVNPIELINFASSNLKKIPNHYGLLNGLINCAWFSAEKTNCGENFPSLDLEGNIESFSLSESLTVNCQKNFWERVPFSPPFYFKQLFGEGSCPTDIQQLVMNIPLYQGDINEGKEFIDCLLAEAASLKQWTIPFGAYVQIDLSYFKAVKLFEFSSDIACVFVDSHGNFYLVWVSPVKGTFTFSHEEKIGYYLSARLLKDAGVKESSKDKIEELLTSENFHEILEKLKIGLEIILASIIRDFWVIEERESIFGTSVYTKKHNRLNSDSRKKTIVYLPRVRYIRNIKNLSQSLDYETRKPHFVTGHLRKALNPSENQLLLAQRYGIVVPEGFTFVKPHKRGEKAQEKIYRSRSALQCINALKPNEYIEHHKDQWFLYELNTKEWLESNGFTVDHISSSKNGDGGVDIQAVKKNENILVQCKYWHTQKVGPNIIREMMGTLQSYPENSKGLIVTTSNLSLGAKELAQKNNIQYIENVDFFTGIKAKL